ncbi:MAG: ATP synthase F1 subunit delta [Mycoplasmatales bacterium]
MNNSSLAMDYAKIFFEVCEEKNVQTEILYQTRQLQKIHGTNVNKILTLPTIDISKKIELINSLKEEDINIEIVNLLKLLVQRKHFTYFAEIMNEFQTLFQKKSNIVLVKVTTATNLSAQSQDILVKQLEQKLNKQVVLLTEIEPDLIGGVKIQYDSKEIDNTIKKHLREFIAQL